MRFNIKKIIQVFLFLGLGISLLYIVYRVYQKKYLEQCAIDGIPAAECDLIQKVLTDFQTVNFSWLIVVFSCFLLSNLSRSIRWRMLIEPLGKKPTLANMFLSIMLSYFANLGFPRIGEFVRAGAIARYTDLPAEKVMGTVVLDRLADLLIFLVLCVVVLLFQWQNILGFLESQGFSVSSTNVFKQVALLIALGIVGIFCLRWALRTSSKNRIIIKIQEIIRGFWEGIKTIAKIKRVGWFVFHSLMIWVMFYCMTYFGFRIFEPTAHLGMKAGLTVFVFGALGFVIPSPGGMGTYHFFLVEALKIYDVTSADGFSFANILFFSIQIGCNAFLGIIALILLPMINKNGKAHEPEADTELEE